MTLQRSGSIPAGARHWSTFGEQFAPRPLSINGSTLAESHGWLKLQALCPALCRYSGANRMFIYIVKRTVAADIHLVHLPAVRESDVSYLNQHAT